MKKRFTDEQVIVTLSGYLAAQRPWLLGPEPPHRQLCPAPGRQGPGGGGAPVGRLAEGAAVRLSPDGGLAGPGRGPGAVSVAAAGLEHSPSPAAPPPFWQPYPPAGRWVNSTSRCNTS